MRRQSVGAWDIIHRAIGAIALLVAVPLREHRPLFLQHFCGVERGVVLFRVQLVSALVVTPAVRTLVKGSIVIRSAVIRIVILVILVIIRVIVSLRIVVPRVIPKSSISARRHGHFLLPCGID